MFNEKTKVVMICLDKNCIIYVKEDSDKYMCIRNRCISINSYTFSQVESHVVRSFSNGSRIITR